MLARRLDRESYSLLMTAEGLHAMLRKFRLTRSLSLVFKAAVA